VRKEGVADLGLATLDFEFRLLLRVTLMPRHSEYKPVVADRQIIAGACKAKCG